jgi:serine phosphatase RsbU (regulator of sigma subunit)
MADRRPSRILVVDDENVVRKVLMMQLAQLRFSVRGAEHGQRALEMIKEEVPDLVLCDMRMPTMDGLELLRQVRRAWPDLPVVVMSGAGLLDDAVGALRLGAWDYVTKPTELVALEHTIKKAVEKADLIRENRLYREKLEALNDDLATSLGLLAEDQDAGRQMQLRLLPKNHQRFGPFEFLRELFPSVYLSGDFIDAFAIDDRRWAFYLADVSGHGASSALVTILLRALVRQSASTLSPAGVLRRLNAQLLEEGLDKHLTIFYGVLDLDGERLEYANAGHYPFPLLFDGQKCTPIEQPNLPAGLMPNPEYLDHQIAFPQEGTFAVFSDGVLEILPQPDLASKMAYLRALVSIPDVTIEDARLNLHLDARLALPDDVAFLFIKRGKHDGYTSDGKSVSRPS